MNAVRVTGILAAVTAVLAPAATSPAQAGATGEPAATSPAQAGATGDPADNGRPGPEESPRNPFLQGWMAELLDGDRSLARRFYGEAAQTAQAGGPLEPNGGGQPTAEAVPESAAELALLRQWEATLSLRERRVAREALEERNVYVDTDREYARMPWRSLDRLQREFAAALGDRDGERLRRLREELGDLVTASPSLHDPRPLLPGGLAARRGESRRPAVDQQIENWRRERETALASGDQQRARTLRWRIWHKQRTGAQQASRQLLAKRWTEMTRLHLAGEHERASGMERLIRGTESRFGNRGRSLDAEELIRSIEGSHRDNQRARLERVRRNLDELLGRRDLLAAETAILQELAKRLAAAAAGGGDPAAGLVLAAHTPYRRQLFRSE